MGVTVMRQPKGIPKGVTSRELPRRTVALTLMGLWAIGFGISVVRMPVYPPESAVLFEQIPLQARVTLWISLGTITAIFAWVPRWQWISTVAAVIMPVERAVSYAWAFIMWVIPGPPAGHPNAIGDALRWACIALLYLLISGWVELDKPRVRKD